MSTPNTNQPFEQLGGQLRLLREKHQESLAEVAGAVEIETETLTAIEQGIQRPVEDILLLLISHFGAKEDTATKLWELAGYDQDELPAQTTTHNNISQDASGVIVLPGEARIVYTDMVHVMVNNYGVVMNFMQTAGPGSQPLAISRIGMSKEHAQSVLEVLQKTLSMHQPKTLPNAKNTPNSQEKTDQQN